MEGEPLSCPLLAQSGHHALKFKEGNCIARMRERRRWWVGRESRVPHIAACFVVGGKLDGRVRPAHGEEDEIAEAR